MTNSVKIYNLCNFFSTHPILMIRIVPICVFSLQRHTTFILSVGNRVLIDFIEVPGLWSCANNLRYNRANKLWIPLALDPVPGVRMKHGRNNNVFMCLYSKEMRTGLSSGAVQFQKHRWLKLITT